MVDLLSNIAFQFGGNLGTKNYIPVRWNVQEPVLIRSKLKCLHSGQTVTRLRRSCHSCKDLTVHLTHSVRYDFTVEWGRRRSTTFPRVGFFFISASKLPSGAENTGSLNSPMQMSQQLRNKSHSFYVIEQANGQEEWIRQKSFFTLSRSIKENSH